MASELKPSRQRRMVPPLHYMDIQTEVNWAMRSTLIDWLVRAHEALALRPEVLFLTTHYVDRFLSRKLISSSRLQLVGITAMIIAAKYEGTKRFTIKEIFSLADERYTRDEVLKAERFILYMLGYELGWPGPLNFLRRISKADDFNLDTWILASYFLEVTIMDAELLSSLPSCVAAAAYCTARLMLAPDTHKLSLDLVWSPWHVYWSGYTWADINSVVFRILECCQSHHISHTAVYEKYSDCRFRHAAAFVEEQMNTVFAPEDEFDQAQITSARSSEVCTGH